MQLHETFFFTVHLHIIVVGNQLDAQVLLCACLNPPNVSSNPVLFPRRTIVLIQHLV